MRLATVANIDVDTGGLLVIDGVQTEVGDRILVKDQTDGSENGIRTVSAGQWYRAADARTARTLQKGTTVAVQEGAINAGKTYRFDTDNPVIGDTTLVIVDVYQGLVDGLNATPKATPVDEDRVFGGDSAASYGLIYTTWAQIKSFLFVSPALTGTPTAPTAASGANTTQIATTAFVKVAIDVVLGGVSSAFDTLSEIATDLGLKMVKSANLSDISSVPTARSNLVVPTYVATRAALKALDTTKDATAILTEAGRQGVFIWTAGNFTTLVAADTSEGIYIKATAIASSTGAWVRVYDGPWWANWFGLVANGPEAGNVTALNGMLALAVLQDTHIMIGAGAYGLNAAITVSTARGLTIEGAAVDTVQLIWSGATNGIAITYTDATKPSSVKKLNFLTQASPGGEALKITAPNSASLAESGPVLDDIDCRGFLVGSQYWAKGIHLTNVWYAQIVRPDIKGKDNTFDMTHGIHLEDCQAPQIREATLFHCNYGIQASGSIHGEGVNISGGEMVGVNYGIDWSPSVFKPGITIHDLHINASTRCLRLTNLGQTTIHDLLLYKTNVNEANWQAIEMVNCLGNEVHDIYMATPSVVTGSADGITLASSTYNHIHDIHGEVWTGAGVLVLLATGADSNDIHDLIVGRLAPSLTWVGFVGSPGVANKFRDIGDQNRKSLTANNTTPSVGNSINGLYRTANTGTTAVTNFADGFEGQLIEVLVNDTFTTFTHNANLILNGGVSGPRLQGSVIWFRKESTLWREVISYNRLIGTATFDPPSLVDGAGTTTTVTVTGAAVGDAAMASFSLDTQGITVTAWISAANTVSVRFQNESGGTLDLASGTLKATVFK
ncbi:hypothetical protein [Mesorhizobium sp.]|uniref:hypothetical protein n=1 Tax=Mesorhizobium sp. TaxID=1871066 RepID=UPI0025C58B15|nr:hypothetical protein [Mesorhizobium sp.]